MEQDQEPDSSLRTRERGGGRGGGLRQSCIYRQMRIRKCRLVCSPSYPRALCCLASRLVLLSLSHAHTRTHTHARLSVYMDESDRMPLALACGFWAVYVRRSVFVLLLFCLCFPPSICPRPLSLSLLLFLFSLFLSPLVMVYVCVYVYATTGQSWVLGLVFAPLSHRPEPNAGRISARNNQSGGGRGVASREARERSRLQQTSVVSIIHKARSPVAAHNRSLRASNLTGAEQTRRVGMLPRMGINMRNYAVAFSESAAVQGKCAQGLVSRVQYFARDRTG
jgi:hypothetical protein